MQSKNTSVKNILGDLRILSTLESVCLTKKIKKFLWSSHHGSAEMNLASIREDEVQSLALISGLRIWGCRELW